MRRMSQEERRRTDGETEAEDGHHGQVTGQVALVAEGGERLVGIGGAARFHGDDGITMSRVM
jgi:hypothetical protein